jgi:hypothetical protein
MKLKNTQPALYFKCLRDSPHPLVTPTLTGSYNTVYAVHFAHSNCAFGTTSHTPKPLGEMRRSV